MTYSGAPAAVWLEMNAVDAGLPDFARHKADAPKVILALYPSRTLLTPSLSSQSRYGTALLYSSGYQRALAVVTPPAP